MLKVDIEKKDEIRFFLSTNTEYKGKKQIRDLFDNSTVFLNNYMKKHFDYTAPTVAPAETAPAETSSTETETEVVQTENEIMDLAYSNLYSLMSKHNISMDKFYNHAMQVEEINNINIEVVDLNKKLKSA